MRGIYLRRACLIIFLVLSSPCLFASNSVDIPAQIFKDIDSDVVGMQILHSSNQILILTNRALVLFDRINGKELGRYEFGVLELPLRLDIFDIDKDDVEEIVVTSVSSNHPSSYIFKIADTPNFGVLLKGLSYYLRVIQRNGEPVLVGQSSLDEEPFAGGIFQLVLDNSRLRKSSKIDLPKGVGIYQFAYGLLGDGMRVWTRNDEGYLRLFEKRGRRWKTVYKTSDRYRGTVNCFLSEKKDVMTEEIKETVCVPTPPIIINPSQQGVTAPREEVDNEAIIIDSHDFLMGGVILRPELPRKSHMHYLVFSDTSGLVACRQWGAYQGWIGSYVLEEGRSPEGLESGEKSVEEMDEYLLVLINNVGKYLSPVKLEKMDISNIDCSGKI